MENILQYLKEKGYKLTHQRKVVLEVIIDNVGNHLTVEELYELVKKQYPDIGLATVYRTIQLLEEMGLVLRLELDHHGIARYELVNEAENHQHHHLICNRCKKVTEVEEDHLEILENEIEKKYNFKIENHSLKFYGLCEECKRNS
ncbi:ferric uptake regulator, Fur family [Clostridium cellulovorans 743B]|uniref:Ferric uptake regulator, Fur family n=2 Tax=Clostridium cellulovorans TaxID=1493 RepID=D9SL62_CLOC7|nr:ferric uptake regulator, Fur family [Clostridium cellulovorans 743B]